MLNKGKGDGEENMLSFHVRGHLIVIFVLVIIALSSSCISSLPVLAVLSLSHIIVLCLSKVGWDGRRGVLTVVP